MEDDLTVVEMRREQPRAGRKPQIFMKSSELRVLRTTVLRVSQPRLSEQLINPSTGQPVAISTLGFWENGHRAIPLWAARRVRDLAEVARRYDRKVEMGG